MNADLHPSSGASEKRHDRRTATNMVTTMRTENHETPQTSAKTMVGSPTLERPVGTHELEATVQTIVLAKEKMLADFGGSRR